VSELLEVLIAPLRYPFMLRGLLAVAIVGVVCAVIGTFVVLRGMALFGGALAHAVLPGVALGYIIGGGAGMQLFWWGLAAAVATSVWIGRVGRTARIKEDTAVGIIFAGMFALGIALISTIRSYAVDLTHFLFGNVLGITVADLLLTAVFGGLVVLLVAALFKEFVVISFDITLARTLRLAVEPLRYLMLVLIAVTIVVSLQAVGIALMSAMLVTPAATGYLLARRLPVMMLVAAAVGAASGVIGLYLAFYFGIASGPAVVLVCTAFFLLAYTFAPRRGWFTRLVAKRLKASEEPS
jgi:ABC-type Mn2+/Zn2+ transport system permease subunit